MWEPRGHADMYGCILLPPAEAGSDFGVLFLHNEGFSTMCGHGIIAVTTVVLEAGLVPAQQPHTVLRIDTPAGLVVATATVHERRVEHVAFTNVPSFVSALDVRLPVPGLGEIVCDIAFGGAFYAYVDAAAVGLTCTPEQLRPLIAAGSAIKHAVIDAFPVEHPEQPGLSFLYGTIFTGPPHEAGAHSRQVCVFADGEVDRSPTGTGVAGRLALLRARGRIGIDEPVIIESIIGSRFSGRVLEDVLVAGAPAVIPEVAGRAFITGRHEFVIDPRDPLCHGFFLR